MKIVDINDIIGSEYEVKGEGWTSRRMLLAKDGMGFSMHETLIPAGAVLNLHYKHHLEAVYCIQGNGEIEDLKTGEKHQIKPGILYALNDNDKHILRGGNEQMVLICVFNPPVTGTEVHREDGSYELRDH